MARIDGIEPDKIQDDYVRNVLAAQTKTWGAPLLNHLIYARRPTILRGARACGRGSRARG